jgi:hypothetical protein
LHLVLDSISANICFQIYMWAEIRTSTIATFATFATFAALTSWARCATSLGSDHGRI